ncbi:energy transducer TonB [Acetobacteraceae bacterium H6797]|nr:energy transducer TonB [Acetobacteraceae bacterium H6797]
MTPEGAWRLPPPRRGARWWLIPALLASVTAHLGGMGWLLWQPAPGLPEAGEARSVEMRWQEWAAEETAAAETAPEAASVPDEVPSSVVEIPAASEEAVEVALPLPPAPPRAVTSATAEARPLPAATPSESSASQAIAAAAPAARLEATTIPRPPAPNPSPALAAAAPEAQRQPAITQQRPSSSPRQVLAPVPAEARQETLRQPAPNTSQAAATGTSIAPRLSAPGPLQADQAPAPAGEARLAALRTPECLVPVTYPEQAREAGWAGRVLLKMRVSNDGRTVFVEVQESSGWAVLDEAARLAAKRCRFEPALRDGRAVWSTVRLPITFTL